MKVRKAVFLLIAMFLSLVVGLKYSAASTFRVVAMSGDTGPVTTPGYALHPSASYPPVLNNQGTLLFNSPIVPLSGHNGRSGVYMHVKGQGTVRVAEHDVPLGNQGRFTEGINAGSLPSLNNSGTALLNACHYEATTSWITRYGFATGNTDSMEFIATPEQLAPGGNGRYSIAGGDSPSLNDSDQIAYRVALSGTTAGNADNLAVYRYDPASAATLELFRKGQLTPDGRGTIASLSRQPRITSDGSVYVYTDVSGSGQYGDWSILASDGVQQQEILRHGDPAPVHPTTNYVFDDLDNFAVNNHGHIAFRAGFTNPTGSGAGAGIFVKEGTNTRIIAKRGDAAPGVERTFFNSANNLEFNDTGQVLFASDVSGNGLLGAYLAGSAGVPIQQVAFEGDPAPNGLGLWYRLGSGNFAINDAGQVALLGRVRVDQEDPVQALVLREPSGAFHTIATEGQSLLGSTISQIGFAGTPVVGDSNSLGSGNYTQLRSGLNEQGEVAFAFELEDGRSGVALWTSDDVLSGDFNDDDIVNLADYTVWRDNLGTADEAAINSAGDGLPGVGVGDYVIWKSNFSQGLNSTALVQAVPEPTGLALLMLLSVTAGYQRLQSSLA